MPFYASNWTSPSSWLWQSYTQSKAWSYRACVRWPNMGSHSIVQQKGQSNMKLYDQVIRQETSHWNFKILKFHFFGSQWGGSKMRRLWRHNVMWARSNEGLWSLFGACGQGWPERNPSHSCRLKVKNVGNSLFYFSLELFQGIVKWITQWLRQPKSICKVSTILRLVIQVGQVYLF